MEYFQDPSTNFLLKRDSEHKAACFKSDGNSSKCIPSFSIAGMPKSGTSALYFYLNTHHEVVLQDKEMCALKSIPGFLEASGPQQETRRN